jgi:ATP-dependent DNA helicase RecQ
MANSVLQRKIKEKIDSLPVSDNIIVVLTGIPLSLVDSTYKSEDIETILENKLKYFSGLVEHRKYITYEEFLLLYSFVLEQYDAVYIVNNNLYINQYPIEAKFSKDTREGLLTHFSESEDENDERPIGNIDEIIALYDGVRDVNGYLIGAYCDSRVEVSSKIINVNLFDPERYKISSVTETVDDKLVITEEADFINLVRKAFKEPEEIYIQIANNYSGDQELLKAHIAILAQNWSDSTDIYEVKPQVS